MDYQVLMSTFGKRTAQQLAANLPPPKRETKAVGTVRVPAEHTIVLGGLFGLWMAVHHPTLTVPPLVGEDPLVELARVYASLNGPGVP